MQAMLPPMSRWASYLQRRADPAEMKGLRIIGQTVLRARVASSLTQRQLAYRVGLNQSTLSRLENGRLHAMRLVTLARIIGVLNLAPGVALEGEPPPTTRRLPGERLL